MTLFPCCAMSAHPQNTGCCLISMTQFLTDAAFQAILTHGTAVLPKLVHRFWVSAFSVCIRPREFPAAEGNCICLELDQSHGLD